MSDRYYHHYFWKSLVLKCFLIAFQQKYTFYWAMKKQQNQGKRLWLYLNSTIIFHKFQCKMEPNVGWNNSAFPGGDTAQQAGNGKIQKRGVLSERVLHLQGVRPSKGFIQNSCMLSNTVYHYFKIERCKGNHALASIKSFRSYQKAGSQ